MKSFEKGNSQIPILKGSSGVPKIPKDKSISWINTLLGYSFSAPNAGFSNKKYF